MRRQQVGMVVGGDFSPGNVEGLVSRSGIFFEARFASPSAEDHALQIEEMNADAAKLIAWRDEVLETFNDDEQGQLLVMGMMDGLRGKTLREVTSLTEAEFPTKYKKVQRRIEALQASRRKP
jgi:hypothetical protein